MGWLEFSSNPLWWIWTGWKYHQKVTDKINSVISEMNNIIDKINIITKRGFKPNSNRVVEVKLQLKSNQTLLRVELLWFEFTPIFKSCLFYKIRSSWTYMMAFDYNNLNTCQNLNILVWIYFINLTGLLVSSSPHVS